MQRFLFQYGFESPDEWVWNQQHGTDDESSEAFWIRAPDEAAALKAGRALAQQRVAAMFAARGGLDFPGWIEAGYAHWIEPQPNERFSRAELGQLEQFDAPP